MLFTKQAPDLEKEILPTIGFSSMQLKEVTLLRQKDAHIVYRLVFHDHSYILKWFACSNALEVRMYTLLQSLNVSTLPVYACTAQALLLEDLENSLYWRLATDEDMQQVATGRAVAAWYRQLHSAGRGYFEKNAGWPGFLKPWLDVITLENLQSVADRFGFSSALGWQAILESFPALCERYRAQPQNLNYSDFAAENLALSCDNRLPRRAVVFDYDCFSIGTIYSDWRNVTYALQGAARQAFVQDYGSIDPGEKQLDEPLSILEGLIVAAQRTHTPGWAMSLLESVKDGSLASSMVAALV